MNSPVLRQMLFSTVSISLLAVITTTTLFAGTQDASAADGDQSAASTDGDNQPPSLAKVEEMERTDTPKQLVPAFLPLQARN